MNILIAGNTSGFIYKNRDMIKHEFEEEGSTVTFVFRAPGDKSNFMEKIREAHPDLLVTEDLEGFEMCTLTDAVSYNLVHCRQVHFLLADNLANEHFLNKQLSLVMTFVCRGEEHASELLTKYPDLPEVVALREDILIFLKNFSKRG